MANQKLLSWNVNGLRAAIKKGFHDFLKTEQPDVLCPPARLLLMTVRPQT